MKPTLISSIVLFVQWQVIVVIQGVLILHIPGWWNEHAAVPLLWYARVSDAERECHAFVNISLPLLWFRLICFAGHCLSLTFPLLLYLTLWHVFFFYPFFPSHQTFLSVSSFVNSVLLFAPDPVALLNKNSWVPQNHSPLTAVPL